MNHIARPFADQFSGSLVQDSPGSLLVRTSTAIAGGIAVVALLALVLGR